MGSYCVNPFYTCTFLKINRNRVHNLSPKAGNTVIFIKIEMGPLKGQAALNKKV